jgi:hypothetical protein
VDSSTLAPDLAPFLWKLDDAGKVLYSERICKLNRRTWAVIAALLAFMLPFAVIVAVAGPQLLIFSAVLLQAAWTAIIVIPITVMMLTMRVRVCERGLIVETTVLWHFVAIIPYAAIDPATVMVHWRSLRAAIYRYRFMTAASRKYPWPGMVSYILVSQTGLRIRFSGPPSPLNVFASPSTPLGISFRGMHPVLASPRYRDKGSRRGGKGRGVLALEAWNGVRQIPELKDVVTYCGVPVMRWVIGTDNPEHLLRELENAMVAAGIPDAAGLTDRALANPWPDLPPRSIPADPALW